jgi:aldose 1-epimerase
LAQPENGDRYSRYALERGDVRASFSNFGASLIGLEVPDRRGVRADVVLGFDTLAEYDSARNPYFGGIIGRCANRTAGARFSLDGREYALDANHGRHHLHGGARGFDRRVWDAQLDAAAHTLRFFYRSPDGEQGYPGNLEVRAVFSLLPDACLELCLEAECDAPTPLNLTQHSYFNLAAQGSVAEHLLEVRAGTRIDVDDELIPSGDFAAVNDGPYDLRTARRLGDCLAALAHTPAGGLDVCYALDGGCSPQPRSVCRLSDPHSGRVLELHTTQPGLQVYSANRLRGLPGKGGVSYARHAGVCLEPQHFPGALHHAHFPPIVLRPGVRYRERIRWYFSVQGASS